MSQASPPRLCAATLARAPSAVRVPGYDRTALETRVVHLGPGGFHRAHQAAYFDDLNHLDPGWGVAGVALRRAATVRALAEQDGLYTLAILGEEERFRIIGAHAAFLAAREAPERVMTLMTAPSVRLVTLTITEKGYCLGADGRLDHNHPDIVRDLAAPAAPASAVGWIAEALRRRKAAGASPFHVMSCDNLADNGGKLRAAVLDYAAAHDADLARWIADDVRFPSTMVDSITPAADDALRARVAGALGLADAAPVQREPFTSWIIERTDADGLPPLEAVGAVLTSDVAGHERAKLRLLNGAHSALAYLGLARGHVTVADAMADPFLAVFITRLQEEEIAPGVVAPAGLDLNAYAEAVRARFANRAIRHELAQIAWDGSQKLPIRLFGAITDNLAAGRPIARLATAVAAWMRFVRRRAAEGVALVDPAAERLARIGAACTDEASHDVALFVEQAGVLPSALATSTALRRALETGYADVMAAERARPAASG